MTKSIPQGPDLVGKLCGVSNFSLATAKRHTYSDKMSAVIRIDRVIESKQSPSGFEYYGNIPFYYAYPMPDGDEAIEQMKSGV